MYISLVRLANLCYNRLSVGSHISASESQTITTSTVENFFSMFVYYLPFWWNMWKAFSKINSFVSRSPWQLSQKVPNHNQLTAH